MIGIIGAMPVEMELLLANTVVTAVREVSGMRFHSGRLCGREVVLVQGGVGKVNAAMCAQTMILLYRPELVINVGVAGCLTDRLAVGDIAIARDFVQYDVDSSALGDPVGMVSTVNRIDFPCAPRVVEAMRRTVEQMPDLKGSVVRIASGDRFNDDGETAELIRGYFRAEVCEMEGCPIAQVCFINGTDCVAMRGISDSTSGSHSAEYGLSRDMAAHNCALALMAFLERGWARETEG